jgi:hypothetical protein
MLIKMTNSKLANAIETLVVLLAFIGLVVFVWLKIEAGGSTDQYIAMSGVKLSYIQAWYICLGIPVLLLLSLFLGWFLRRDERDFKKKYGKKHNK